MHNSYASFPSVATRLLTRLRPLKWFKREELYALNAAWCYLEIVLVNAAILKDLCPFALRKRALAGAFEPVIIRNQRPLST